MDDAETERQEFLPILKWLDGQEPVVQVAETEGNVVNMEESRKIAAQRSNGKSWHSPIQRNADKQASLNLSYRDALQASLARSAAP